jgi:hypothetical protein
MPLVAFIRHIGDGTRTSVIVRRARWTVGSRDSTTHAGGTELPNQRSSLRLRIETRWRATCVANTHSARPKKERKTDVDSKNLLIESRQGGSQPAKGRQESAGGRICDSGQHLDSESQSRGSTGSLSSASTPKTHSCVRSNGSFRMNRSKASCSRVINYLTGHAHQSADHPVRDFYETVGRLGAKLSLLLAANPRLARSLQ